MREESLKEQSVAPRHQPHYCRQCGEHYPESVGQKASAHAQVSLHRLTEHREKGFEGYSRCSRNCQERAQPEEIRGGQRLYGNNLPPLASIPLIKRYEDLFPEETEDA